MDVSKEKRTTKPTGPVRNGVVFENTPEYNIHRIRALRNKRYRTSLAYQNYSDARRVNMMYRWRVLNEQARRRNIAVLIDDVPQHCNYNMLVLREFTYKGYSGEDRLQNLGTYQGDNVVACCKT